VLFLPYNVKVKVIGRQNLQIMTKGGIHVYLRLADRALGWFRPLHTKRSAMGAYA